LGEEVVEVVVMRMGGENVDDVAVIVVVKVVDVPFIV